MKRIFSFLIVALFSVGMWAATETTVYYAVPASVVGTYTVKLNTNQQTNPDSWHAYTMTKTELTYEDNLIYSASFTDLWDGVDKMQFQLYDGDDWKSQEQPISSWTNASAYNGMMWVYGGSKWIELSGEEPDPTVAIKGAWDSWATTPMMELATDKKTASIELAMTEGVYEFGLELNSSWTANGAVFTRDDNSKEVTGAGDNMKLTVDADGDYTFTWTFETNTLTVTYPDVVVIPAKYYLTGDSALVVDAGYDKAKAWSPSAIKVTEDTYVLSDLKAGQIYSLKITVDGTWSTAKGYEDLTVKAPGLSSNSENNIIFKMATTGDVTITYNGTDFTVAGDFAMPEIKLFGNFTSDPEAAWVDGSVMAVDGEKKSASIEMKNLAAGTYRFKVKKDGILLGKANESADFGLHRNFNAVDNLGDGEDALAIETDMTGDYTFTYSYEENKLVVSFPELPDPKYYLTIGFNGDDLSWTNHEMKENDGVWSVSVELEGGRTDYRFKIFKLWPETALENQYFGAQDDDNSMYSGNSTNWTLTSPGENINMSTIKDNGSYSFEFSSDSKLDVIYPSGGGSAVDNTDAAVKAVKTLENGQLIIEKNGKRYDVFGNTVK